MCHIWRHEAISEIQAVRVDDKIDPDDSNGFSQVQTTRLLLLVCSAPTPSSYPILLKPSVALVKTSEHVVRTQKLLISR